MATDPSFAATIHNGAALLGNAETNLQTPTTASQIIAAGSSGTKIEEVVVEHVPAFQTISAMTNSTTTVTATVTSTANLVVGQGIAIENAAGMTNVNGSWTVASIVSGTQFTFVVSVAPTGTYTASSAVVVGGTVGGLVYLFLYDGTTYHLYDVVVVAPTTTTASAPPFRGINQYNNLVIKSGWSLYASQSVAQNANVLKCHAFAGDF